MSEQQRMTPAEFKEAMKRRGWNGRTLATRWGISYAWMSKITNNAAREAHWDDALNGLPICKTEKKSKSQATASAK